MKQKCDDCGKMAIWFYGPGKEARCEDHVPRGCSCNYELKPGIALKLGPLPGHPDSNEILNPPEDYYEPTDAKGRYYPCCEWLYSPEGEEDDSKLEMTEEELLKQYHVKCN